MSDAARTGVAPGAPARTDARLEPAFAALADPDVRVLSLDIFDTLLWRKVPEPVAAFELMAQRLRATGALAPDVGDEAFVALRRGAEAAARAAARARGEGSGEVTLALIHAKLPAVVFSARPSAAALAELECAVERDLLVPDLDVVALVAAAREQGKTVVAVSDTYFTEAQLRLFIARGPLADAGLDRIFPSNRHGAGKGSGLFSVVLEELGVPAGAVLHVGDNRDADIVPAQRLGLRTVYFERRSRPLERIFERERALRPALLDPRQGDHGLSSLRGKVLGRVEGAAQPEGLRPFWDFGAAALGPALTGFGEWVHEQAVRAGVSKVFCLMREGELLARLVNGARPLDGGVEAEPIWLSRQVCARASIREGTRDELQALFERRKMPNLEEFAGSLGLALSDLPGLADHAGQRLDDHGLGDAVIDAVVFDPELRTRVVATSQALRRRVLRYLESVRPPGEDELVLVDLGWGATIQATTQRILDEAGASCRTSGLYLLTRDQAAERAFAGLRTRGFLAEYGVPEGPVELLMRSPEILEQVCMPDHGSQVDMTEDLKPVLADVGDVSMQSVERAAVQEGILAFEREWMRYRHGVPGALAPLWDGGRERLLATVLRAVAAPTPDEAALFAGWLHDENFGSDDVEPMTSGRAARALRYAHPRQLVDIPMTEIYWPFGLAALHDETLAHAVAAAGGGVVPWEVFSAEQEAGPFDVYPDLGWGYEEAARMRLEPRRNLRGLSLARATVRGDWVKSVRLDPATSPCIVRIDWIRLGCKLHGGETRDIDIADPAAFKRLKLRGCHLIGPQLLMVPGDDPNIIVDVERAVGGRVYEVAVECAYATLPISRTQARERWGRAKRALLHVVKDTWAGAPLRLVGRLVRRLR